MSGKVRNSIYNISTDMVGRLLTLAVSIILPRLYINNYGSEVNGLLTSLSNVYIYLNLLEAGIGSASIQALYKPIIEKNNKRISEILSATRFLYRRSGLIFLVGMIVLSIGYPAIVESEIPYWTVVILILLTATPYVVKFFFQGKYTVLLTADNHLYILNIVNNSIHIAANVVKAILLFHGINIVLVQCVFSLLYLLQVFFISLYVNSRYKHLSFIEPPDFSALSKSKSAMVHEFAYVVFNNTAVVLLTLFSDLKMVSVYSVYSLIFMQLTTLLQSITNGVNAALGQLFVADVDRYKKVFKSFEFVFQCFATMVIITAGVMARSFIVLYTAGVKDIDYIIPGIIILFVTVQLLSLLRWPSVGAIKVAGMFQETSKRAVIEVIINLGFALILVRRFGIHGVLFASIVALLYRIIDVIYFVGQEILKESSMKRFINVIGIFIFSFVLFGIESGRFSQADSYSQFIIYGFCIFAVNSFLYGGFMMIVNRKALSDVVDLIRKRCRRN